MSPEVVVVNHLFFCTQASLTVLNESLNVMEVIEFVWTWGTIEARIHDFLSVGTYNENNKRI